MRFLAEELPARMNIRLVEKHAECFFEFGEIQMSLQILNLLEERLQEYELPLR